MNSRRPLVTKFGEDGFAIMEECGALSIYNVNQGQCLTKKAFYLESGDCGIKKYHLVATMTSLGDDKIIFFSNATDTIYITKP